MKATTKDTLTHDNGRCVSPIMVIEYYDERVSSVITKADCFMFDYCKRNKSLYYHSVGSGMRDTKHYVSQFVKPDPPRAHFWIAPDVQLVCYQGPNVETVSVADSELASRGYVRLAEPLGDPFENAYESECRLEYCSVCDDMLPDDDLCGHVYLPGDGIAVGVGSGLPSQKCVFAAFDWLAGVPEETWRYWCFGRRQTAKSVVNLIEKLLISGDFERVKTRWGKSLEDVVYESFRDDQDNERAEKCFAACEDGLGWLTTLGPDTPAENAKTLMWLMEWRLARSGKAV